MLGNEGQGLSPKQISLCDSFVYIPQHGCGTASLNVAVACSIVLHHFALWAGETGHVHVCASPTLYACVLMFTLFWSCTVKHEIGVRTCFHAGYDERERQGQKFVVAERQHRTRARGVAGNPEDLQKQRLARRNQGGDLEEDVDGMHGLSLFDDEPGAMGLELVGRVD